VLIGQAITLRYKPVNLDVLPLFIVLVLAAPFMISVQRTCTASFFGKLIFR
jgi:hypothetical protein